MNFEIQLPLFQGPFDLLLFFIERDELDIHDIPISKITKDFLEYLEHLERLNLEVASEFILVASTLMRVKAKMLVPRPEKNEEGVEIDPRKELVERLMEYKRYKSVIQELGSMEEQQLQKERRGNVALELKKLSETNNVESELQDIDLYKLLKVFEKVVVRFKDEQNKPIHEVVQYPYTISQQKEALLDKVNLWKEVSFEELIAENCDKIAVIFNFLSILELLQLNLIVIKIGLGYNNFWISKPEVEV